MAPRGVSVIIPAHNAAGTLSACVRSVRASSYMGPVEVIVVDDASTDATATLADSMGCVVVRRRSNGGPAVARNAGARVATHELLLFLDSDTETLPNTIAEAVSALSREGVGAASGMYEPEPINAGFFPRYYAYLKYHAYTCSTACRILAFGAHCGAISKQLFDQVGGYRSIAWGVDVENEEFGRRVNEVRPVILVRELRVRHNFPTFRKLLTIFTRRVYWWVLFQRFHRVEESVLMTRETGIATAAAPLATGSIAAAWMAPSAAGSRGLLLLAVALWLVFLIGYRGFWATCRRRRGAAFAVAALAATYAFSHVITASAAIAHWVATWRTLRGRSFPFAEAALGQT